MKIASYRCDRCETLKGESNHWWLRLPELDAPGFVLIAWDDQTAEREKVEHICSQACASKALSFWMESVSKKPESDSFGPALISEDLFILPILP
jgi:hypothetical protein